ncbi:MAG: hypothetical protein GEV03_07440 [Streptosporangiales bacterium]|nr:hypothetical protein [Streptosporangiales bacterium]
MGLTPGQQRKAQRAVHLAVAGLLLVYVYAPPVAGLVHLIRWVAFPALVLTGLAMWQAPRIRRALGRRRSGRRPGLAETEARAVTVGR